MGGFTFMIDVRAQFPIEPYWPRLAMDWGRVDAIVIHHTAVDPQAGENLEALLLPASEMAPADELNHIRVIHLYHKSIGYGGFGYHLIVFPSGRCYYVVDLRLWGAHVGGMNDTKLAIVLAADCRMMRPRDAQFQGVWEAVNFIRKSLTFALRIGPHSKWTATSCPGMAWPLPKEDEMSDLDEVITLPAVRHENTKYKVVYERPERRASVRQWLHINRKGWIYAIYAAKVYKAANLSLIRTLSTKVADLDVTALRADLDAVDAELAEIDAVVEELDEVIVRPGERVRS